MTPEKKKALEIEEKIILLQDIFAIKVAKEIGAGFSDLRGLSSYSLMEAVALKEFSRPCSKIRTETLRLKPFFEYISKNGFEVEIINSTHSFGGFPTEIFLHIKNRYLPHENVFLLLAEINFAEVKHYPEYQDSSLNFNGLDIIIYAEEAMFFYHPNNNFVDKVTNKINKDFTFVFKNTSSFVEMIIQDSSGLRTERITFKDEDTNLSLHYGPEFLDFHDRLIHRISNTSKGIAMFHGPPGTGKTHYIRRLLPEVSSAGKRTILIPKHVLGALESPSFNQFMLSNFVGEEIVFVIEDAESIISKRTSSGGRSELISTLLNITDGILNDIFSIQVILTFNTELESIDEALLRKGRLMAKYKFHNLAYENAKKLADSIGAELPEEKDYSLAEIYAFLQSEDEDILINQVIKKETKPLGF